jgi:hypothetical protein
MTELVEYSDYLVFVDESGDHHLTRIDPQFPVFVLLFAILRKDDYVEKVCPALSRFKFQFWGHDEVVLHEHDIRKPSGDFLFLLQKPLRERFLAQLSAQMEALPATVVAVVIDKLSFASRYSASVPIDTWPPWGSPGIGPPSWSRSAVVARMSTWNWPSGACVTVPTP